MEEEGRMRKVHLVGHWPLLGCLGGRDTQWGKVRGPGVEGGAQRGKRRQGHTGETKCKKESGKEGEGMQDKLECLASTYTPRILCCK